MHGGGLLSNVGIQTATVAVIGLARAPLTGTITLKALFANWLPGPAEAFDLRDYAGMAIILAPVALVQLRPKEVVPAGSPEA